MRIDILSCLAKNKDTFTFEDAYEILGMNRNAARALLSRLEKGGVIERIEKGKYTPHEFVIGAILANPYSIAYWNALNFYGHRRIKSEGFLEGKCLKVLAFYH